MDKNMIKSLRDALAFSPNNIPLKLHLAESLLKLDMYEDAKKEYEEILTLSDNPKAKFELSRIFYIEGKYSKCCVILEDLITHSPSNIDYLTLYAKALLKENNISKAIEIYQNIQSINPNFQDNELDNELKVNSNHFEEENLSTNKFIEKPNVDFDSVGGMEHVKKEIDLKIIQPLKHPEIYKAYGKKIGGGILLYGPPGCGKTYIAKATAGEVNAAFISVSLNDILDMWIGNSEKNLHEIFESARQNSPCVLFIDEIDALGASRADLKQSAGRNLINQFLQELDGIDNVNDGVLVLGATNTPWHLDQAFRRPGRFDRVIFVSPPDEDAREIIFKIKLRDKPKDVIDYRFLAKISTEYSGADIEAIIDIAIESKLEKSIKTGIPELIRTKDLKNAIKKHKATTKEWFVSAKNYALFANESGLYDDILNYLKIRK